MHMGNPAMHLSSSALQWGKRVKWGARAALLAAAGLMTVAPSAMLMDEAAAVEVTSSFTPPLPQPTAVPPAETPTQATGDAPSKDCFILGSKTFSIPYTVTSGGVQPAEVQVFVKRGRSQDWSLLERKRPEVATQQFRFTAQEDGEYWFATRTIDSGGQQHPSGGIEPQLKVYVDTTKPQVGLQVDAQASGKVVAKLAILDATPLKNIQLRYATDSAAVWKQVDVQQLPADGNVQIQPDDAWRQISVQCIVTDTPGNQGVIQQLVKRPRVAVQDTHRYASATGQNSANRTVIANHNGGTGLQIQAAPYRNAPYRGDAENELRAGAEANPVLAFNSAIQLDRNRQSSPPPSVSTAHGVAAAPAPGNGRSASGGPGLSYGLGMPSSASARPASTSGGPPTLGGFPFPTTQSSTEVNAIQPAANQTAAAAANQTFANQFPLPQTEPVKPADLPVKPETAEEIAPPLGDAGNDSSEFSFQGPQQRGPDDGSSTKPPTPPQTAAEAMRPLEDASAVESNGGASSRELIPTPNADSAAAGSDSRSANPGVGRDYRPQTDDRLRANRMELTQDPLELAMQRAPRRYSDSFRFSLDYELEAVGSLGVEAIELYGTVNSGKTWNLWGRDPDRVSPFDIETKEEGVFGFRIVVLGQNGLASPRPLSGESPDIVVVVDTTAPKVRITGAEYGEGNRLGALVIRYECSDQHLLERPVALSFSDSVQGPWTTIAAGLQNDGDYVWPADPQLPRKLYLRIDVTDEAGNVGTYVLQEAIDVQGLAPRARIRGFQSLSGDAQAPVEGQTAKRAWSLFQ